MLPLRKLLFFTCFFLPRNSRVLLISRGHLHAFLGRGDDAGSSLHLEFGVALRWHLYFHLATWLVSSILDRRHTKAFTSFPFLFDTCDIV